MQAWQAHLAGEISPILSAFGLESGGQTDALRQSFAQVMVNLNMPPESFSSYQADQPAPQGTVPAQLVSAAELAEPVRERMGPYLTNLWHRMELAQHGQLPPGRDELEDKERALEQEAALIIQEITDLYNILLPLPVLVPTQYQEPIQHVYKEIQHNLTIQGNQKKRVREEESRGFFNRWIVQTIYQRLFGQKAAAAPIAVVGAQEALLPVLKDIAREALVMGSSPGRLPVPGSGSGLFAGSPPAGPEGYSPGRHPNRLLRPGPVGRRSVISLLPRTDSQDEPGVRLEGRFHTIDELAGMLEDRHRIMIIRPEDFDADVRSELDRLAQKRAAVQSFMKSHFDDALAGFPGAGTAFRLGGGRQAEIIDKLLQQMNKIHEIGEARGIKAHGTGEGRLWTLMEIMLEGRISGYDEAYYGRLAVEGAVGISGSGNHGPFYVGLEPSGIILNWRVARNHAFYLVPDTPDAGMVKKLLADAVNEGLISPQHAKNIADKTITYEEFIKNFSQAP